MVYNEGVITHIVLYKLRLGIDPQEVAERLRSLEGRVPSLRSVDVGTNVVDSPRAHDVSIVATFDDLDGLEAYQVDSYHQEVVAFVSERVERAASIDYESGAV